MNLLNRRQLEGANPLAPLEMRKALKHRALSLNKTESQLLRELIDRDLEASTLLERVKELVGTLDSSVPC